MLLTDPPPPPPPLKHYIEASDLVYTYIVSVLASTDFRHGWAIFGHLADKITPKGELVEIPAREKFSELFFLTCFEISIWNLVYNHLVGSATHQVKSSITLSFVTLTYFTAKNGPM